MAERLDAWLSHRGFGTRSEARNLVRGGVVTVDGAKIKDCGARITDQVVRVHGDEVARRADEATLVLNKPVGWACSHDPREAPLIEELVPLAWSHLPLESAGRLDRDTSGLLIVTTDGDLIHRLTNPRKKLIKRYRIRYRGLLSAHAIERCATGMQLEGDSKPTLPAKLVLDRTIADGESQATLHLSEGRYHQVRRMIAALGGEVVGLHRDRIGRLELPADIPAGGLRPIEPRELDAMMMADEEPPARVI